VSGRIEQDSLGPVRVPDDALYGAQTQRAVDNFSISGEAMPAAFIAAVVLVKQAAARANVSLGLLDATVGQAIESATARLLAGEFADQFPVDVYQTGSGTSTNMNVNEVVAALASATTGGAVHPNDDVNRCQSSNDVIPAAIHISAARSLAQGLLPALDHLAAVIERRAAEFATVVKTGRTHLMDAMPLTLGQELGGWAAQVRLDVVRLRSTFGRLLMLPLGGTAVGTGVNAHPEFARRAVAEIANDTGLSFRLTDNTFAGMAAQDTAVELSGQLRVVAVTLTKIANDLRWMNSGPLAGLGEIALAALQPGSSIMPGKVNPVVPEAVAMAATQVIGNDTAVTIAGASGNFQLNVMLPLIARNLLQSSQLLARAARALADAAIGDFIVNQNAIEGALARNPILVTALNPIIGYAKAAEIAKRAYAEGRAVVDVAAEMTDLSRAELARLLDPAALTRAGDP
jgi:fumarate hydratase class II